MRRTTILLIILLVLGVIGVVSAAPPQLADYAGRQFFTYQINSASGDQTDYQVRFVLSNKTGISGTYGTDNIIYTGGLTRPDWVDINATDGSGNPLSFWVENNTQTAYNATAWVRVPSVLTAGTSTGRWYYGNSTQTVSTMDGLNTFISNSFDDFVLPTYNVTMWTKTASGSIAISGGYATITGSGGTSWHGAYTTANVSQPNVTVVTKFGVSNFGNPGGNPFIFLSAADTSPLFGARDMFAIYAGGSGPENENYFNYIGSDGAYSPIGGVSAGTQQVTSFARNLSGIYWTVNRANPQYVTNKYYVDPGKVSYALYSGGSFTVDWIFSRKLALYEPTIAISPPQLADYTNNQSFTYNIASSSGDQTDYQVKFILSNSTGTSGTYGTDNIIYTNGVTRPDWADVNATDGSMNPLPFWLENNTFTAHNATAWIRVPSVLMAGTSAGKWYFGNASQTASTENGLNTFLLFDDFLNSGSVANATKWSTTASTTTTIGSGEIVIYTTGAGIRGINSTSSYGVNNSIRTRSKVTSPAASNYPATGYTSEMATIAPGNSAFTMQDGDTSKFALYNSNAGTTIYTAGSASDTNYHIWEMARNGGVSFNISEDNTPYLSSTTNIPSALLFAMATARGNTAVRTTDWIFTRRFVALEPTITLSGGGNATPISADFSGTPTTSAVYAMPVQFTDASIGTPTTWNWTFGDTYTSTLQNPLHFYDVAGQYDVSLNVTNSTGSYSLLTKTAYITLSSDLDSNLKSWMHYNTSATFDSIGNAWTALGGAALTAAPFKMGGTGSLDLTTNNARITSASATTWNLGSNDFTIEFWIYPNTPGAAGNIISRTTATGSGTGSGWGFYNNGAASGYGFWMGSVTNLTPTFSLTNGVWQHVVIQRTSGTVNIYVNGVLASTRSEIGNYDTVNPITIGRNGGGATESLYLDEFRYSTTTRWNAAPFSIPTVQYAGVLGALVNNNPNATFRYKTDPTSNAAVIYNQTNGGYRNRTVQIQNLTKANYIEGGIDFDPLTESAVALYANLTDYPDLVLVSSSIDNTNGIAYFTVARSDPNNPITSLFDNRTNLANIKLLYWNYTTAASADQFFTNGTIVDNSSIVNYPVHYFIMTPIYYGTWDFAVNFNADNVTPVTGQVVTFTDATAGYPNRWNWSFGDGTWTNGSSSTSATHTYSSTGLKTITMLAYLQQNMSVTNTTTKIDYINVSAGSSYTNQDTYQTAIYILTITVTDSSTGQPIPGVAIADSTGRNTTTNAAGIGILNEPYSTVVGSLIATGYVPRGWSVVVDNDTSVTYQMTPSKASTSNVIYIPQQVRFRFYDQTGSALNGMYVSATPLNFTAPTDWTQLLFGISPSVNINGTTTFGYTGTDGSWATPMLASFQYNMIVLDSARNVNYNFTLYPSQPEYVYTIPIGFVNVSPLVSTITYSLGNATINFTAEYLNMSYDDTTAGTSYLQFVVYNQSDAVISSTVYTGGSANSQIDSVVLDHTSGQTYRYGIFASQSTYGWLNETKTLTFEQHVALYGTSPTWIEFWLAVGLLVLFGAAFSIFSIRFGMLAIPLLAFFFEHVLGWFTIGIGGDAAFFGMMVLGVISYIRQSENKIP